MRKAYSEIMDRIIVTDEMRERILNHIQAEDLAERPSKRTGFLKKRRYFAAAACIAVLAAGAVTWHYTRSGNPPVVQPNGEDMTGGTMTGGSTAGAWMPDESEPGVTVSGGSTAGGGVPGENVAGGQVSDDEPPGIQSPDKGTEVLGSLDELSKAVGFLVEELQKLPFEAEQISYYAYQDGMAEIVYEGNGERAVFRKSSQSGDNSGDYNVYEEEAELEVDGREVLLKGSAGAYVLAVWEDEAYAYSLSLSSGQEQRVWENIIKDIER